MTDDTTASLRFAPGLSELKASSGLTAEALAKAGFPPAAKRERGYDTAAVDDWIAELGLRLEGLWQDVARLLAQAAAATTAATTVVPALAGSPGPPSPPPRGEPAGPPDEARRIGEAFMRAHETIEAMLADAGSEAQKLLADASAAAAETDRRAATAEADAAARAQAAFEIAAAACNRRMSDMVEQYRSLHAATAERVRSLQEILSQPLPTPAPSPTPPPGPGGEDRPRLAPAAASPATASPATASPATASPAASPPARASAGPRSAAAPVASSAHFVPGTKGHAPAREPSADGSRLDVAPPLVAPESRQDHLRRYVQSMRKDAG